MEEEARKLVAAKEQEEAETLPTGGALIPFQLDGMAVRVIEIDGEPWFVLADVCRVLELTNPSEVANRLDEDEKRLLTLDERGSEVTLSPNEGQSVRAPRPNSAGGARFWTIISQEGLYELVLTSRKKEARKFSRWVRHEVLPSIQRTGSYTVGRPDEPRDVRLARHLVEAHGIIDEYRGQVAVLTVENAEEREGRLKAEALAAERKARAERAEARTAELAAENAAQAAPARRRATPPDALDRASTTHDSAFQRGGCHPKTPPIRS